MLLLDSPAEQTAKVEHFKLLLYISHVLTIILVEEQNILPQKSVDEKLGGWAPPTIISYFKSNVPDCPSALYRQIRKLLGVSG